MAELELFRYWRNSYIKLSSRCISVISSIEHNAEELLKVIEYNDGVMKIAAACEGYHVKILTVDFKACMRSIRKINSSNDLLHGITADTVQIVKNIDMYPLYDEGAAFDIWYGDLTDYYKHELATAKDAPYIAAVCVESEETAIFDITSKKLIASDASSVKIIEQLERCVTKNMDRILKYKSETEWRHLQCVNELNRLGYTM